MKKRSKQKVKSVKIDKNKNVKTFYIYAITIRTAFWLWTLCLSSKKFNVELLLGYFWYTRISLWMEYEQSLQEASLPKTSWIRPAISIELRWQTHTGAETGQQLIPLA